MKTLIIFNNTEDELRYFIVEGDYSRFHGIVFNTPNKQPLESECAEFLWDEQGEPQHDASTEASLIENKEWDKVAIITWLP
jgi:hypothetical protein